MSRLHDPHRSFFPFGNPFRKISPKGSRMSPQLLAILNAFEARLAERLRKLVPENKDELFSMSWMTLAVASLCETHTEIKTLVTDLELPVCEWDEKWIDVYLDISVKLLDICNAFSSELSCLIQGQVLLQCGLHNLDTASSEQFVKACSSLDGWRQHINSRNRRIEKCGAILDNLAASLDLPKVKNSDKGKVLMQAMYGVKVQTVFVCCVFAAAFSRSSKLLDLDVADSYSWAQSFTYLKNLVNQEIRIVLSNGSFSALKELEAVDASVKKLYPTIQGCVEESTETKSISKTVEDLGRAAEKLSEGLDLLAKGVDGFFQVVLSGRDALLSNLRSSGALSERKPEGNRDELNVLRPSRGLC